MPALVETPDHTYHMCYKMNKRGEEEKISLRNFPCSQTSLLQTLTTPTTYVTKLMRGKTSTAELVHNFLIGNKKGYTYSKKRSSSPFDGRPRVSVRTWSQNDRTTVTDHSSIWTCRPYWRQNCPYKIGNDVRLRMCVDLITQIQMDATQTGVLGMKNTERWIDGIHYSQLVFVFLVL